jgi:hypothetical protein
MGSNAAGQQFGAQNQAGLANLYGGLYGQNLGLNAGMAQNQGYVYQPTYQYQKGGLDYLMDAGTIAAGFMPGFMPAE